MGRTAKIVSIAAKKPKNAAAVALGRLGGLKGGKARAEKLSASERKEIAQRAARARWANRESASTRAAADQTVATKVAAALP